MGTPAQVVEQSIQSGIDRREGLEDEKRKGLLKTLLEDATTPADKMAAYDAVYHKDPGVLRQHVENLTRRMTGKQPQPVVSPQDAQQARIAPLAARGKTPEQQALDQQKASGDIANKGQMSLDQMRIDAVRKIQADPTLSEEDKQAMTSILGVSAPRRPTADDQKRQDYQSMLASGQAPKDAKGNPLSYEAWNAYQSTSGRLGATPTKPQNPLQSYVSLTAKKLLADKKQGPPLTNEESAQLQAAAGGLTLAAKARADEMAAANARYGVVPVYDDATGSESLATRKQVADAASSGNPMRPGVLGAPTGMDKKNQMLAQSAINQIDTMESILDSDPNLAGPGAGQWTKFQQWLGSNSEDSQQFLAAATFASEHGVGVFGGRNIHSINDLQNLMGNLKTNPKALKAALEQTKATMAQWTTAGGRLPGPKKAGASPSKPKGATMKVPGSDGKLHWSDGKVDLGVVQ